MNILWKLFRRKRHVSSYTFHDVGFHGDKHLLSLVDHLIHEGKIEHFVETGANVGSTLAYVAKRYPDIDCYSCEPDKEAYAFALENTKDLKNVKIYNLMSQEFLKYLQVEVPELSRRNVLFWLDAHGYGFTWPLKEEVTFVTSKMDKGYMLIDDFKVPEKEQFGYDEYMGQVCSYEFIKDAFLTDKYRIYYPNYAERTSKHHVLRGWGLFVIGMDFKIPYNLKDKMIQVQI